jgi:spore coat protein A
MLNGSNARWYHLTLIEAKSDGTPKVNPGPSPNFNIIGTDGGFRPSPATATEILIAPSERYDIVIDFSGAKDKCFLLSNDATSPFPDGDDVATVGGGNVMLFRVKHSVSGNDTSSLPHNLGPGNQLNPDDVKTRDLILSELESSSDEPVIGRIDARGTLPTTDDPWTMPVTEKPKVGSVEIWRIINTTGDAHPIHIHLVQFQVLDRQRFDTDAALIDTTVSPPQIPDGNLQFTGPRVQPKNENARQYLKYEQNAFKDTVKTFPGEVTRVIMRFDLPTGTPVAHDEKFRYVLHCHILEHEDNDMMRPYDVVG